MSYVIKLSFACGIAGYLFAAQACATDLPPSVSAELKRAHIPLSSAGIVVQEVGGTAPAVSLNADEAMNPASTMKLLTTFAALETLGPAYRWDTEAYLDGKLENGVLDGNLVFRGHGDPKLTIEQFWLWLRELRQRGLRDIRGDIVLDYSAFEDDHHDPAEFDNDPTRAYNVGTNALLLNFNATHLHLIPNGKSTIAVLEPELAGYTVQNSISTSTRLGCHGGDAYKASLDGHTIKLEGSIPANCGEQDDYFSLLPHDEYFYAVFGALWRELGGSIQGTLRVGTAPAGLAPFARYVSPELSEMIRDINKFSNNIMARQLFLTLGTYGVMAETGGSDPVPESGQRPDEASIVTAQAGGDIVPESRDQMVAQPDRPPQASIERSIEAIQRWLNSQHLQFPELVLENGAGLSRLERISAKHLAELLQRSASSPFAAELEASLPILGMDGTVRKRFTDSEIAGLAHIKTGTLEGVKSMAGYVKTRNGKKWVVVFIINHPNAAMGQAAQDALIEWLENAQG